MRSPCPCLDCGKPDAPRLSPFSVGDRVAYYRCEGCGCVWTLDKHDLSKPPTRVTSPARPSQVSSTNRGKRLD
jgi:hypothetical protein